MSTYNIEHIKEAFSAARRGLTEAAFLAYLEVRTALSGEETVKAKRGRKPGTNKKAMATKVSKPVKKRSGKKGSLNEKILAFLATKKDGAHTKEIADAVGSKQNNITSWTQTTGKNKVKKVAPATFVLK